MPLDVLSTAEAARRLGVTPGRVRQWITAGYLPAQRVGRAWLLPAAAVGQFIRQPPGWHKGRPRKERT